MRRNLKKKFIKIAVPLCALSCVFALGLFFGLSSWDKSLYVTWNPSKGRGIAATNPSQKILSVSYSQLTKKAGPALIAQKQVIEQDGSLAFYLGNFLAQDPFSNQRGFICQIFPLVEFSFSAMGLSLSGEEGLMIIQSPCNMENEELIGPFWIPAQEILSRPESGSFELAEQETFIRFYNASIILTPSWILTSARFFSGDEEGKELLVRFNLKERGSYFELSLNGGGEPVTAEESELSIAN